MFERNAFLRAYNIDEADFKAANVPWEELAAIYDDYLSIEGKLRGIGKEFVNDYLYDCLLYTSPSPRDRSLSRMPSSA